MEENKKISVKLEKHLWPDQREQLRKAKLMKVMIVIGLVSAFVLGVATKSILTPRPADLPIIPPQSQVESHLSENKFNQIYSLLSNSWYFSREMENPKQQIMDNAIEGMIEKNGDQYTEYFTKEEMKQFQESINQNFVGIGIQYYQINGTAIVQKVFRDAPADKAGIKAGDILYKVDGVDITQLDKTDISKRVRGDEGTTVVIEVKRDQEVKSFSIVREPIHSTAYGEIKEGNIGYLQISSFGLDTGQEVKKYLDYFTSENISKLIIDVRDNGGGYLSALHEIASYFLDSSAVVIQQETVSGEISKEYSEGNKYPNFDQIVMLFNEHSASASEVLIAALNDNLSIETVGVTSFGKGTVQTTISLADQTALKYTIAQWLTPKGNRINKVGITPKYEIRLHDVFYQEIPQLDPNIHIKPDMVHSSVIYAQQALDFLGYSVDRFDGYFSAQTAQALTQFIQTMNLESEVELNATVLSSLSSQVQLDYYTHQAQKDVQLLKAMELLK